MVLRRTICALTFAIACAVSVSSARADDRRTQQDQGANKDLKKKTQEQLQPSQMMHQGLKDEHLQKAEEARSNKDEGTAQKEEQMAMMEQMKVQQLQQQMDANKDAANKNEQGATKLTETDANDKQKNYDPNVVSVRKGDVPSAPGQKSSGGSAPGTEPAAPPAQIADLSNVPRDALPKAATPAPAAEAPAPATEKPQTINHLLGDLEKVDRAAVVYEDGAKNASGSPGATPQYRLLTSAAGTETSPTVTVSGGSASGGSAGGADSNIWKSEEGKPGRAIGTRGIASSSGGSSSALEGAASLGALDKDFFEPCPDAKEWKKMSKDARGGVRESCRKLAAQCEAKPADKKAPKGAKPKELSAECKAWLGEKTAAK